MFKKVTTLLLVLVAIAGLTAAVYRQSSDSVAAVPEALPEAGETAAGAPASSEKTLAESAPGESATGGSAEPVVTVTYFTTKVRCASCMRIEEWTRQAVASRFADEVEAGRVSFNRAYIDNPANEHYIEDYQLVSKSVVVSDSLGDREQDWVNLQDVWLLLRDEEAFTNHVAEAVNAYL